MKKRYSSNKKKNNILLKLFCAGFVIYFAYTVFDQQIQINKYNSQIEMYQTDINNKSKLVEYYGNQKENVNSTQYIENVARDTLGYVKPYEKIFVDANK
ncbi:MAG: septum formation initiator family protein [Clostridia bacterium]